MLLQRGDVLPQREHAHGELALLERRLRRLHRPPRLLIAILQRCLHRLKLAPQIFPDLCVIVHVHVHAMSTRKPLHVYTSLCIHLSMAD